jgi:DNA-directed RNA polymerase specialized sigma24 family protein
MPYAVLTVGVILIAISIYLATKQNPSPQLDPVELQELVVQIQLTADDAIARLEEKLVQVDVASREVPQLPTFAQEVEQLKVQGLSLEEIATKLGRGKGEIELALGIASFSQKEKSS